jgi:hypothetical protein
MLRRRTATKSEPAPARYDELINSVRGIVTEAVHPGARIVVVSKGDDELLRFDNRVAWHFPRLENGAWAGYHPESSKSAIEHLNALREQGAHYLLLPAPSFWWRDYYPELFEHLAHDTNAIWDDETCAIFELESARDQRSTPSPLARPIARLLNALVPEEATVAVVSSGDASLLTVGNRLAVHVPHADDGSYAGDLGPSAAITQIAELEQKGPAFLVVPHVAPSWVDGYPEFLEALEARYTCIARRQRVCTVYELDGRSDS